MARASRYLPLPCVLSRLLTKRECELNLGGEAGKRLHDR